MPHDNDEHEPELWPYRRDFLISTNSLDDLIGDGVLESRIVEIGTRDELGDRVDADFTEDDFNALTGRDTGDRTRWLYDIGDTELDPIDDAMTAFDHGVESSPILATTLSGHYHVLPGTPAEDSDGTLDLDMPIETVIDAHIAVVDSGYTESAATPTWLANRVRAVDSNIDQDQSTGQWMGHGKFVASIIVQQNPHAFVWVAALKPLLRDQFHHWVEVDPDHSLEYYVADELALYSAVRRLLDNPDGPEAYRALNLSVGAWAGGLSISGLVMRAALKLWRIRQPDAPILAAAGNHLGPPPPGERFIPGQLKNFPGVFGIKSLTQDEQHTSFFSNEAPIGAVGEALRGVRQDGKTTHWSGTSFATAVVSAHVAKSNPPAAPSPLVKLESILAGNLGTPPTPPP